MNNQSKILLQNIKLLLFSILISLYLCEIFLLIYEKNFESKIENKAYKNRLSRKETAKNLGIIYDDRTPLEFYLDNKDVLPPMHPTQNIKYEIKNNNKIEIFPLSGFSNKKTFNCAETGPYNVYQSDKYGFNNNTDKYIKNINSILVGDSFGLGDCVKYNEGIAYQLNKYGLETLNLSYGGNGPLLQYSTLIEYGFELTPKNIIWLYFDNDLEDLSYELKSKHLSSYLKDDVFYNLKSREIEKNEFLQQRLNSIVLNKKEIAGIELEENVEVLSDIKKKITDNKFIKSLLLQRLIYTLADRFVYLFKKSDGDYCQRNKISTCMLVFPTFKKILFNTKKRIEKNNGKITFVFLPVYDRFFRFNKNQDRILYKGQVKKILKDLDINYIDIFDLIENENDPNNFFPMSLAGHYNAYGYEKIAIELKNKLK